MKVQRINTLCIEDPKNQVDDYLDRITELWSKNEERLLAKAPPRRISCCYDSTQTGPDGDDIERRYLGLQRDHGRWRICHAVVLNNSDTSHLPWKPITECDVATRVDATRGIGQLADEVAKTNTKFIPDLRDAIERLGSSLED